MPAARRYTGQLLALASAIAFGTNAVLVNAFEDEGGDAVSLIASRVIVGFAVFAVVAWCLARALPPRPLLVKGLLLGFAFGSGSSCLVLGYANAPASLVVLMFYVYPLLVVMGASVLLGERLGRRRVAIVVVGMVGLLLALGTPSSFSALGVALGLGAAVATAFMVLGSRHLMEEGLTVWEVLALMHLLPAAIALPLLVSGVLPWPPASAEGWTLAIAFALGCSVLPTALFFSAIERIGAGLAALIATFEPVWAIVLAYVVLDETLEPAQLAGGALVIAAVATLSVMGAPEGAADVSDGHAEPQRA